MPIDTSILFQDNQPRTPAFGINDALQILLQKKQLSQQASQFASEQSRLRENTAVTDRFNRDQLASQEQFQRAELAGDQQAAQAEAQRNRVADQQTAEIHRLDVEKKKADALGTELANGTEVASKMLPGPARAQAYIDLARKSGAFDDDTLDKVAPADIDKVMHHLGKESAKCLAQMRQTGDTAKCEAELATNIAAARATLRSMVGGQLSDEQIDEQLAPVTAIQERLGAATEAGDEFSRGLAQDNQISATTGQIETTVRGALEAGETEGNVALTQAANTVLRAIDAEMPEEVIRGLFDDYRDASGAVTKVQAEEVFNETKVQGNLQEELLEVSGGLSDAVTALNLFDERALTLPGKARAFVMNSLEDITSISKDKKFRREFSTFRTVLDNSLNAYIERITGAQMSELEVGPLEGGDP